MGDADIGELAGGGQALVPEPLLRELEQRAHDLDLLTLAVGDTADDLVAAAREHIRRRLLLTDLAAAGLLTDPLPATVRAELARAGCPILIGYLDAAEARAAYQRCAARRAAGLSGSPRVSLDWFRLASPTGPGTTSDAWLAGWERTLADTDTDAAVAPDPAGYLLTRSDHRIRQWHRLEWRRDDGGDALVLRVEPIVAPGGG